MDTSHIVETGAEAAAAVAQAAQAAIANNHGAEDGDIVHRMTILVLQAALILFAVRLGGAIVKNFNLPSVLGELLAGIIIGPYLLGAIPLSWLGFPAGIFPVQSGALAVTPELYGLGQIASIILLFMAGLETDLQQFLKYSIAGTVIGIGGVVVSFIAGDASAIFWGVGGGHTFLSPPSLFLGVLCTATSVGITARILSERKQMDSPEGVTILAAAIIDDVLGIIALAIIIAVIGVLTAGGAEGLPWGHIGLIALKTVAVCVVFAGLGLAFANRIARFLKSFQNPTVFAVIALGMAMVVGAIFESAGLAMIVGAYVTGLSLSKTDITFVLQERLHALYEFFVPLFFAVMGMLVDLSRIFQWEVMKFGLIYTAFAVLAKIAGCALPALFLNFTMKGAFRIGAGMVPRGEVALIVAGIGLSAGIISRDMFGAAIIMTLLTTMVAPPILTLALSISGKGVRREIVETDRRETNFAFPSEIAADAAIDNVLLAFHNEGFFTSLVDQTRRMYHLRRDNIAFSLWRDGNNLSFSSNRQDVNLINTVVYEAIVQLHQALEHMRKLAKPDEYRRTLSSVTSVRTMPMREKRDILTPETVIMRLGSRDKMGAIRELVAALERSKHEITDLEQVMESIIEREEIAPTELEFGVAMPHGRTDAVDGAMAAVGIAPDGLGFVCLDESPVRLMILVVSPKNTSGPHLQFLASVTANLRTRELVDKVVAAQTPEEAADLLIGTTDRKTAKRASGN
ncbi:MAG: cation:proton antiporter [Planctomycetota bacterium]|jgi:Kef-type K+ transport system membrane component KefB/mannitol/fructose-specific phosphotransferase system IIA component (Ntr-type)|nr:cation:proton antiporter [Planctomycetota bacterium]